MLSYLFGSGSDYNNLETVINYVRDRKTIYYDDEYESTIEYNNTLPFSVEFIVNNNIEIGKQASIYKLTLFCCTTSGYYNKYELSGDNYFSHYYYGKRIGLVDIKNFSGYFTGHIEPCLETQALLRDFKAKHQTLIQTYFYGMLHELNFWSFEECLPQMKPTGENEPYISYKLEGKYRSLAEVTKILLQEEYIESSLREFYSTVLNFHSYSLMMKSLELKYNVTDNVNIRLHVKVCFTFVE